MYPIHKTEIENGRVKSELTHENPQKLVDNYAGTGKPTSGKGIKFGENNYNEVVKLPRKGFKKQIVGIAKSENNPVGTATDKFKIHYSCQKFPGLFIKFDGRTLTGTLIVFKSGKINTVGLKRSSHFLLRNVHKRLR